MFNRDFIVDNVFPLDRGSVPPILILGKENIANQKRLDELKSELVGTKNDLEGAKSEQKTAARRLESHCRDKAKFIKELLRGSSGNPYNNYDKRDYLKTAEAMARDSKVRECLLSDVEQSSARSLHRGLSMPLISQVDWERPNLKELVQRTRELASRSVVSQVLSELREDAVLAEWVRQGLDHHARRGLSRCAYCDQLISESRTEDLNSHFSAELKELTAELKALGTSISEARSSIDAMEVPGAGQFFKPFVSRRNQLADDLSAYQSNARDLLSQLDAEVERKQANPFERINTVSADFQIPDFAVFERLRELVTQHNRTADEYEKHVVRARESLELHYVATDSRDFAAALKRTVDARAPVFELTQSLKCLKREIGRLRIALTQHRTPAEELNADLRQYVGHDDIWLEVEDNGYKVVRHGVPTSEFSEGEVTAIALLYFLKSLDDVRFDLGNGIVVLDDPVSSLDANSLYLAYAVIRERTMDAGQLFIMTHNFTFFRQVRNWFRTLPKQRSEDFERRPARFYMLNCVLGADGRNSSIERLDPLLEKFESDYHYLFARVFECATQPGKSLEEIYALPNMARRLLETFLAFRRPDTSSGLTRKMEQVQFNEVKKLRSCASFTRTRMGMRSENRNMTCSYLVKPQTC